jgi:hypothetical protein
VPGREQELGVGLQREVRGERVRRPDDLAELDRAAQPDDRRVALGLQPVLLAARGGEICWSTRATALSAAGASTRVTAAPSAARTRA